MGSHDEMSETFAEWNKGELDSFLIEISTNILKYRDESGDILLEKIKDSAGQKGTGKWTAISALEYGMPVTLIGESVFARCLSSLKEEREKASTILQGPEVEITSEPTPMNYWRSPASLSTPTGLALGETCPPPPTPLRLGSERPGATSD